MLPGCLDRRLASPYHLAARRARHVDSISRKPVQGPADSLVLFHLVLRRAGPVLRSQPATLAHVARPQPDCRLRVVREHDGGRDQQIEAGILAGVPAVPHAVLRFQFCGAGEGQGIRPDFFPATGGDIHRDRLLRGVVRHGRDFETAEGKFNRRQQRKRR